MKKHSIIFRVHLVFFISFALISASFILFYGFDKDKEKHLRFKKDMEMSKIFMHHYKNAGVTDELVEYMNSLDFSVIKDKREVREITGSKDIKSREIRTKGAIEIRHLRSANGTFVHVRTPYDEVLLVNNVSLRGDRSVFVWIYAVIVFIFALSYLSVINKLKPLRALKYSVKNFGNEKFDMERFGSDGSEVSELANEFYLAAQKLKMIKESRNVFIRNIMHELKTPIAKGRFLLQLEQTEHNRQRMQKVFYRLESLINEFASIEELISTKKELHVKEYYLEDVIDNAADILMCAEDEMLKEFANIKIHVDFNLFSVALKNLIDNGIKYSEDKKVTIKTDNDAIIFENRAKELTYELDSYFEPFFKGDANVHKQSFGLGLYIVKHILDAHGFTLIYEHEKGINRFVVKLGKTRER